MTELDYSVEQVFLEELKRFQKRQNPENKKNDARLGSGGDELVSAQTRSGQSA